MQSQLHHSNKRKHCNYLWCSYLSRDVRQLKTKTTTTRMFVYSKDHGKFGTQSTNKDPFSQIFGELISLYSTPDPNSTVLFLLSTYLSLLSYIILLFTATKSRSISLALQIIPFSLASNAAYTVKMMDFFISSNHNNEATPEPQLEPQPEPEKPGFNDLPMEVSHQSPLFNLI